MEKKFKVGDKVRFNSEWGSYRFEDSLFKGEVIEISDITGWGGIYVKKYVEAHVTDDEIELVSRPSEDKKTAFLTELKELLERYEVVICGSPSENIFILVGENKITYSDSYLIFSNIFDYDK